MAAVDWYSLLQDTVRSPYVVPTVGILSGVIGGVMIIFIVAWMHARTTRMKEKMIDRGFSAAEIEQVVKAKTK